MKLTVNIKKSMVGLLAPYVGFSAEARIEFLKYVFPMNYSKVAAKLPSDYLTPIDSEYFAFSLFNLLLERATWIN